MFQAPRKTWHFVVVVEMLLRKVAIFERKNLTWRVVFLGLLFFKSENLGFAVHNFLFNHSLPRNVP